MWPNSIINQLESNVMLYMDVTRGDVHHNVRCKVCTWMVMDLIAI